MDNGELIIGALYATRSPDGRYRVVKVLAADEGSIHLRMYAERFASLPVGITSAHLSLGSLFSGEDAGIGHAPVSRDGLLREHHVLITQESVSEEELEGYRIWAGEE